MNDSKRSRMSNAEINQLEAQIYEVLEQDHPQSVRHVFYRMTNPRLPVYVPKTDKGQPNGYNKIQQRMVKMRRAGKLPYGWVSDTTRRGYHTQTYMDRAEFLRSVAFLYRADVWRDIDTHVEVWCESRSIAGVIEDVCKEYAVSLYPAGGFSSLTLIYEAADAIGDEIQYEGKTGVCILYVGDYDPAGVLVDQSIERGLRGHLPGAPLELRRIGINEEQIARYNLPTKPRKTDDKRAQHIRETVEAEAMPAGILRELLREELNTFIPARQLQVLQVAEESERDSIRLMSMAK